ncbi:hypothetical protein [Actinomadura logoneensis]|uniref:hypothetical protein n=1 Tax=Actinomadura logoneensis TaxID=2293572 RepID=UPI001F256FF8|nr:hypothetical protein [Actinomadura logoneensis]
MAVVALLVVGGIALFNAVNTGDDSKPRQSAATSASNGAGHSGDTKADASTPLVIKVVGPATDVLVTVAGSNKVLAQGPLNTGEGRKIDEAPLNVVAQNGGAVQVTICGKVQPRKPSGQRGTWFVGKC